MPLHPQSARIDAKACILAITAFVSIGLERDDDDPVGSFERAVAQIDEVLECCVMAGRADYQTRVLVKDFDS